MTDLTALALNASLTLSSSELHGVVCGLAVCGADDFELSTLIELVGADALSDADCVSEFVEAAITALLAEDLRFQLLLPDDEAPLAARAEALAEWCAAFLAGLGARLTEAQLPRDSREIIGDFVAISELEVDIEETEEVEAELVELEEFAKVGTLLLMDQLLMKDEE